MVVVEVTRGEARGDLPPVCVCCGRSASARYRIQVAVETIGFRNEAGLEVVSEVADVFNAPGLGIMWKEGNKPFVPLSLPLCSEHELYRQRRSLMSQGLALVAAILLLLAASGAVSLLLLNEGEPERKWLPIASGILAGVALLLGWAAWLVKWQPIVVHPGFLLTMVGVHPRFAQALQEQRSRIDAVIKSEPDPGDAGPFQFY